jgi:membrane-associated PAP2 superfamily phosphatase
MAGVLRPLFALLALAGLVFAIWPGLDRATTHVFYDHGGFLGGDAAARMARSLFADAPIVVLCLFALAYTRKRFSTRIELWLTHDFVGRGRWQATVGKAIVLGLRRLAASAPWAPSGREMAFLIASLIIGSGLIVNLGMKDHLHRPRPVQVVEFGGKSEFRPWWRFDGACRKNCGFASGEAASAFWMTAPALLAPPPYQAPAVAAALAFGAGASLLRMAFGGHFLSDVLAGALISLIVVFALRALLWPRGS